MSQPSVTRIHVEYADGSYDDIRSLRNCPLYGLDRKRADADVKKLGAYSAGAIAMILFRSVVTKQRTEYPIKDPKLIAILRQWYDEPKPQKTEDQKQSGA